jgi:3,2-trans-enoyl-CoA isomerase
MKIEPGNDLLELHAPKTTQDRYIEFWTLSNQFLADLYNSRLITICLINGNCPAGGCVLSLCCDYRIASVDALMGLNETALGIPVPEYWVKLLCTVVGQGKADKMVQFAQMIPAQIGIKIGMVDQVVEKRDDLISAGEAVMKQVSNCSCISCYTFLILGAELPKYNYIKSYRDNGDIKKDSTKKR